ncbi:MAG: ATP-binding cassette domain-containing protein [Peptoclostridium sp.]|uniref:ATP-binding cassette domain-containing protein n=1 Tax=Peptoclostridium sp. TaxID=1904860 RepID=UPI00139D9B8B|nr:ATP-binding cassette domain-containing protein [Peptoclostridium sp.]MZQ75010.1 ATP-binding cassette domain-containing protein [Peptoclostridium sp.]
MATDVIKDISLDAVMGEIIRIVGPSGCGKSTMLGVVAGFDKDYSGEVLHENLPISGPSPERGMVFQTSALFDWLSVRDNIGYGLKIKKTGREDIDSEVDKSLMKNPEFNNLKADILTLLFNKE